MTSASGCTDLIRATCSNVSSVLCEQGSSYKFCLLAEGAVEVYVRTSNTYEWDTAAGEVILSEAGGVVEPFGGGTGMQYNKTSLHNPYFVCRSKFFR